MEDHKMVLDLMLANACPRGEDEDGNKIFTFDLHCVEATVTARLVSTYKTIQYEIIDMKMEGI